MKIQTRSGIRHPKGRRIEAFPFADCNLKSFDEACTRSLKGEGKSGLRDESYGVKRKFIRRRYNGKPGELKPENASA